MRKLFLACLLAVGAVAARAEVFYGIQYNDTLGEIKQKYPNAIYEKQKPAWLQPDEAFIRVSGYGMPYELRIAFSDFRPILQKSLNDPEMAKVPDDYALTVMWVRVIYDNPIPIGAFKKKYGKSICKTDDKFQEVCNFPDKALQAVLTQDGKFVQYADTTFTKQEVIYSYLKRGQQVPDWVYGKP